MRESDKSESENREHDSKLQNEDEKSERKWWKLDSGHRALGVTEESEWESDGKNPKSKRAEDMTHDVTND